MGGMGQMSFRSAKQTVLLMEELPALRITALLQIFAFRYSAP